MIAEGLNESQADELDGATLLTAGDLAKRLRVSLRQVYRLDKSGSLPASLKIGQCVQWDPAEIDRWVKAGAPCRLEWEQRRNTELAPIVEVS